MYCLGLTVWSYYVMLSYQPEGCYFKGRIYISQSVYFHYKAFVNCSAKIFEATSCDCS